MKHLMMRLWKEEEGQDLIEYVLLFALIALLVGATLPALVGLLSAPFMQAMNCVNAPPAASC